MPCYYLFGLHSLLDIACFSLLVFIIACVFRCLFYSLLLDVTTDALKLGSAN